MTPDNFNFITDLLYKRSGLVLGQEKAYLLENRLSPLVRQHELADLDALIQKLRSGTIAGLAEEIIDIMTTNESLFFRDSKPFEQLRATTIPYLAKARANHRKLRIWSAAASTGQESYSIAMVLEEEKERLANWNIEILGTDLSNVALNRAKSGIYSQFEVQRGMSVQMLLKYFTKIENNWQVNDSIRAMTKFQVFNLLDDPSNFGMFDVIFCRNVLIYFDRETKAQVLNRISRVLAPDGVLFLGATETILGIDTNLKPIEGARGTFGLPQAAMA